MPRVSVIVPAFDAAATIATTLASVRAQTERDLEVVVVDDGSRDRTAAIVEEIARRDPRVRLLQQPNAGIAAARNAALAAARGELVAPLDADDVWRPDKLARQIERLASAPPGAAPIGLVYAWSTVVDDDGRTIWVEPGWRLEGNVLPQLVCFHFVGSGSCPLIPRRVLDDVGGYDAGMRAVGAQGCEDWDLALRIAERYAFAVAPAYLVGYRRRAGSVSFDGHSMWRSYQRVMARVAAAHPELPPVLWRWSRSNFQRYLAGLCNEGGDVASALRWAAAAVRSDPLVLLARDLRAQLGHAAWNVVRPAALALDARLGGRLRAARGGRDVALATWPQDEVPPPWSQPSRELYLRACAERWALAQRCAAALAAGRGAAPEGEQARGAAFAEATGEALGE